jgi:hypothetical protein
MANLYEACDQISDSCHQYLLRKMRRKISWTDGRTDRQTDRDKTVYPPPPSGSGGIINLFHLFLKLFSFISDKFRLGTLCFYSFKYSMFRSFSFHTYKILIFRPHSNIQFFISLIFNSYTFNFQILLQKNVLSFIQTLNIWICLIHNYK